MWTLKTISAQNLCAFEDLKYDVRQACTTLVFGKNLDNDSQGSNGSGKSAMLEAIAIGLTGETLRKIKMDEIINDARNEATVMIELYNLATGQTMRVRRILSRKSPQSIQVVMLKASNDTEEVIAQASVADYNKYILETIGLTKDDIFANFILSKHKYSSFLTSSDKDKKDIINRFSNGIMVDESIEALQADMLPIQANLQDAENHVANLQGRVSALQEQINAAITESVERSQQKKERIKGWEESIVIKRGFIRDQLAVIEKANNQIQELDKLDKDLQQLEASPSANIEACVQYVKERFEQQELGKPTDYTQEVKSKQLQLEQLQQESKELEEHIAQLEQERAGAQHKQEALQKDYERFQQSYNHDSDDINTRINKLLGDIKALEETNANLRNKRTSLDTQIAELQKQLAGVIVCPNCQHEFVLNSNLDIPAARSQVKSCTDSVNQIVKEMEGNRLTIDNHVSSGKQLRQKQQSLNEKQTEWSDKLNVMRTAFDKLALRLSEANNRLSILSGKITAIQKQIQDARKNLFDEVFDILDTAINKQESITKHADLEIENAKGAIQSYEESIRDVQNASETNVTESLTKSKQKYEQELVVALEKKESIEWQLTEYKSQEVAFVEFKTYLANSKIEALNKITNEFLEAIGSDIRISLSGFTLLKSGKVRDKISISLIRDGLDCGSFDKFSEGEKARVSLSNILAMHKLTNLNCEEGKGLDLLVLDEILDATDEQGLAHIFNALNQLKITSLVVSHGQTAENYPYKVVVNKQNGISYIND